MTQEGFRNRVQPMDSGKPHMEIDCNVCIMSYKIHAHPSTYDHDAYDQQRVAMWA